MLANCLDAVAVGASRAAADDASLCAQREREYGVYMFQQSKLA